jgi:hypothetical protein
MSPQLQTRKKCSIPAVVLVIVASLALGALLLIAEFSLTFGHTTSGLVFRNVVLAVLWVLNPFGTVGWLLCVKQMVTLQTSVWIFLLGAGLSAAMWGHVAGFIMRRLARNRDRKGRW